MATPEQVREALATLARLKKARAEEKNRNARKQTTPARPSAAEEIEKVKGRLVESLAKLYHNEQLAARLGPAETKRILADIRTLFLPLTALPQSQLQAFFSLQE